MLKFNRLRCLFSIGIVFLILAPFWAVSSNGQSVSPDPGTIYFGDMSIYQEGITRELRLENIETFRIQITSIEIHGQHAGQFSVVSGELGQDILPGSSSLFLIHAAPTPYPTPYMEAYIEVFAEGGIVTIPLHATARLPDTYYVSPSGSNNNPGTQGLPWQTLQHAVDRAVPQDMILVEDGIYEGPVIMARSGEAGAHITLKAINKWGAKIEVLNGAGAQDGVKVAANYITVDGFEIYDPAPGPDNIGNGITIYEAHHVHVLNNKVYDFGASGIQGAFCDHVIIENNVVFDNAKYNPNQSSGISIWKPWAVDDEPGYHHIIRNNRSFDNTTIAKNERGTNTDGTGIIIDRTWESREGTSYPHRTLIENNLVYNNGGSGIHLYKSSHVDIINNTAYHNRHNAGITGTYRGELYANRTSDTIWRNNIAYANPGEGVLAYNRAIFANQSTNATYENNITYSSDIENTYSLNIIKSDFDENDLIEGNLIGWNPHFNDAANSDFSLHPSSHAIDAGSSDIVSFTDINYLTRTQGPVDIGAFEYFDETLLVELTSFEALVTEQDIELRWNAAMELNNAGFAIELRPQQGEFEQIRFIDGRGTASTDYLYASTIQDLDPDTYTLRLKKVGLDGSIKYSHTIEATIEAPVLPVELTSFNALVDGEDIQLQWTTASELNNAGFAVEIKQEHTAFRQVTYVEGNGTTHTASSYETLLTVAPGSYALRLKQIDFNGTFAFSDTLDVNVGATMYHLAQSYPNPFNPQTQIPYTLPVQDHVKLEVFDLLGRSVRILVNELQPAGTYAVRFDASDLANGTYVYRLTAGPFTQTKTMVLLK